MQIRVTKVRAVDAGSQHNGKLLYVTWLVEVWPKLVPLTDPVIVSGEITHEYFRHDTQEELDKQDERINAYLEEQAKLLIDRYVNEHNLITTETRIDTVSSNLKSKLDVLYGSI